MHAAKEAGSQSRRSVPSGERCRCGHLRRHRLWLEVKGAKVLAHAGGGTCSCGRCRCERYRRADPAFAETN